jgi:hypothetical protein
MRQSTTKRLKCTQVYVSTFQEKCGAVVESLTVVPMYAGSLPSVATFEIFLVCRSFFASTRIRSGVFHEASLD